MRKKSKRNLSVDISPIYRLPVVAIVQKDLLICQRDSGEKLIKAVLLNEENSEKIIFDVKAKSLPKHEKIMTSQTNFPVSPLLENIHRPYTSWQQSEQDLLDHFIKQHCLQNHIILIFGKSSYESWNLFQGVKRHINVKNSNIYQMNYPKKFSSFQMMLFNLQEKEERLQVLKKLFETVNLLPPVLLPIINDYAESLLPASPICNRDAFFQSMRNILHHLAIIDIAETQMDQARTFKALTF